MISYKSRKLHKYVFFPQLVKHYFSIQDRKMILYKNWADRINKIKINVQSSFNSKTSSISRVNSALNFRMKQHSWRQIRAYRRSFREIFKKEISQWKYSLWRAHLKRSYKHGAYSGKIEKQIVWGPVEFRIKIFLNCRVRCLKNIFL